jgi:hypothetical protein
MKQRKLVGRIARPPRRWMLLTLHWRRRRANASAARPIYNVINHQAWQVQFQQAARLIESSILRTATLSRALHEKTLKTARFFSILKRETRFHAVQHGMHTERLRVFRYVQHSSRSTARSFAAAREGRRDTQPSPERKPVRTHHTNRIFQTFHTAALRERRLRTSHEMQRSLEHKLVRTFHTFASMRESRVRHETRLRSQAELRYLQTKDVTLEHISASARVAPSLAWRKREMPAASAVPPTQSETLEIRKETAAARTAQAPSAPARARPAPFDRATMDRLAEDVISRIERRLRLERERRGL